MKGDVEVYIFFVIFYWLIYAKGVVLFLFDKNYTKRNYIVGMLKYWLMFNEYLLMEGEDHWWGVGLYISRKFGVYKSLYCLYCCNLFLFNCLICIHISNNYLACRISLFFLQNTFHVLASERIDKTLLLNVQCMTLWKHLLN